MPNLKVTLPAGDLAQRIVELEALVQLLLERLNVLQNSQ